MGCSQSTPVERQFTPAPHQMPTYSQGNSTTYRMSYAAAASRRQTEARSSNYETTYQSSYKAPVNHSTLPKLPNKSAYDGLDPDVCTTAYLSALDRYVSSNGAGIFAPDSEDELHACHQQAVNETMVLVEDASPEVKEGVYSSIQKLWNGLLELRAEIDLQLQKAEVEFPYAINNGREDGIRLLSKQKSVLQGLANQLPEPFRQSITNFILRKVDMFVRLVKYVHSFRQFFILNAVHKPLDEVGKMATDTAIKESGLNTGHLSQFLQEFVTQYKTDVWNTWWQELESRMTQEKMLIRRALDIAIATYKRSMDLTVNKLVLSVPDLKSIHSQVRASILFNWDQHLEKNTVYYNVWHDERPKLGDAMTKELKVYKDRCRLNAMKAQKRSLVVLKHALQVFRAEVDQQALELPPGGTWNQRGSTIRVYEAEEKAQKVLEDETISDPQEFIRFWRASLRQAISKRSLDDRAGCSTSVSPRAAAGSTADSHSYYCEASKLEEGIPFKSTGKWKDAGREDQSCYVAAHIEQNNADSGGDHSVRNELQLLVATLEHLLKTSQVSGPLKKYIKRHLDKAIDLLGSAESTDLQLRIVRDQLLVTEGQMRINAPDSSGSYV